MTYDCIIVNGDSYTAETTEHMVYSQYISATSDHHHVLNYAMAGSSNRRIFRSTLEQVLQAKKDFNNILCIVGYSFLHRKEIWYEGNDQDVLNKCYDTKMITASWLDENIPTFYELNDNLVLTQFYDDMFMFYNTLENLNCKYYIFSAAENIFSMHDKNHLENLYTYKMCKSNENIVPMGSFCIKQFAESKQMTKNNTGHMTQQGHREFAKHLIKELDL